jgi:hypothetical protein
VFPVYGTGMFLNTMCKSHIKIKNKTHSKVKITPEQAVKAQRGSRGTALLL